MKCNVCKLGAFKESIFADSGNAVRNRDARQAGAITEGTSPDTGDAIRNRDARDAREASIEGISPYASNVVGYFISNTYFSAG